MGVGELLSVVPKMDTISLTLGSGLEIPAWKLRGDYPSGTTAELVVWDAAKIELARFDGVVTARGIAFSEAEGAVEHLKHGDRWVLYVGYPGLEPQPLRYGVFIRTEPRFPLSPDHVGEVLPDEYVANFGDDYISPYWLRMGGTKVSIHNHLGGYRSLGPDFSLFSKAAVRWYAPMGTDSVTVVVKLINAGAGKFSVAMCADYAMNQWLGVQFETGIFNNNLRAVTGKGPLGWDVRAETSNRVENNDVFTVKYNHLANTISCYKGTNLSPVIEWEDTSGRVQHGEGFRYLGLTWDSSLFVPGCEPTAWEAHAGV